MLCEEFRTNCTVDCKRCEHESYKCSHLRGFSVDWSRAHRTADSFSWWCVCWWCHSRKFWWYCDEIGSFSFLITYSVSNKIHTQSFKKQATSLWLSSVEVWIYGEENNSRVVRRNIQQVLKKYHGPTSSLPLARICSDKFIDVVNCTFSAVVVKNYLGFLVFSFFMYFFTVMLSWK